MKRRNMIYEEEWEQYRERQHRIKKIVLTVALAVVIPLFVLGVILWTKKGADAKEPVVTPTAAPTSTPTATPTPESVVIEFEKSQLLYGELVIYTSKVGIHREYGVVDFRIGDPTNVTGRREQVVALYITRGTGSPDAELWAVYGDGSVEAVNSPGGIYDHRLPFSVVNVERELGWKDGYDVTVFLNSDGLYSVLVRGEYHTLNVDNALDYSVAYDTVYWLVSEDGELVTYCLHWSEPDAEPEVYYRGCIALSHHVDEGEGCLVPLKEANPHYYNRWDLFTPYPNKEVGKY